MAKLLAIDLGAHTVKVALLEGGFGRYELLSYHTAGVPQDVDTEPDLDRRLAALGTLLDELGEMEGVQSIVGFPTQRASVRLLELPFADRRRVAQTLPFEVEAQVPFDLETMVLDFRVVDQRDQQSTALAALGDKAYARRLLAGLAEWELDPKYLSLDGDLLGAYATSGIQAVVDVGHARTLVTLCRDGDVVATRALTGGGRDWTVALAKRRGWTFAEAEGRKHSLSIGEEGAASGAGGIRIEWEDDEVTQTRERPSDPDDVLVVKEALGRWLAALRATLVGFEEELSLEIDEVLLAGGGSALGGLQPWLEEALGVPVHAVGVSSLASANDAVPQRLAIAHALGRQAGARPPSLQFRQGDLAFKGDLAAYKPFIAAGATLALAFTVVGLGLFLWRVVELGRQARALENQIAETVVATFPDVTRDRVLEPTTARAIMQERVTATTAQVTALEGIGSATPPILSLVEEISSAMPAHADARVEVGEMRITEASVMLDVETDNYDAAAKVESSLKSRPRFAGAQKGDEKKVKDVVQFTITIPLDGGAADDEG